jgi:flagellar basal-body rod modification protein FlgD
MPIPAVSNTTTPTAPPSQSDTARKSLSGTVDNFLKLLITQLKNQDPTAPLDTNQMTQQIATLSQVEQQINTNSNLERMTAVLSASNNSSIANYIGKRVEASGSAGALYNGHAEFAYYLQTDAAQAAVTIKDQAGNVVYEGTGTTARGRNQFNWDGRSNNGQAMPDGVYNISIEAIDDSGTPVAAQTFTTFVVHSVDTANGNIYLSSDGDIAIPVEQISSILAAI